MKKQVYEIDENGYIKEIHVINESQETTLITVNPPQGLYRAKWTGAEWVEDMKQEEIDKLNNQPRPLTEIEKLRLENAQANAELFEMMLMLTGGGF